MHWYTILLVVLLAGISVIEWNMIGKPRKPLTRGQVAVDILINMLLIVIVCW